jgi:SAM-dependent methyltransferase
LNRAINYIKEKWNESLKEKSTSKMFWFLSSSYYFCLKAVRNILKNKNFHRLLDLGAGFLSYSHILRQHSSQYISLDINPQNGLDLVGDGAYLPLKNSSIDCVFCYFVLEHVAEPSLILKEVRRVLTDEGELIVGVPLFFYQHGEPFDYHRWTSFGLKYLLDKDGFEVIEIHPVGSVLTLLTSIISALVIGLSSFPVVKYIGYIINLLFIIFAFPFEILFDAINKKLNGKFSMGFIALAKKKNS